MQNILISVIIPCYNASKYLEKAVRSIMNQTYRNLEIICCDDCSADNTLEILNNLSLEDNRIFVIHNEKNLKLIDTLNKLITYTHGEYIARMDSDDICLPNRLEKQLEYLIANPAISFCGCNAWHIDENDRVIGKSELPLSSNDNKFYLKYFSTFYHPTIMAKSEVFKDNPYCKDFIHAEDYELWCRLIYEKGLKGENLKDRLFKYRLNSQGISQQNIIAQLESSAKIFKTKKILDNAVINPHVTIFFKSRIVCEETNKYLVFQKDILKHQQKKYAKIPFIKMISYCKNNNLKIEFVKIIFTANGFYSLLCLLFRRF